MESERRLGKAAILKQRRASSGMGSGPAGEGYHPQLALGWVGLWPLVCRVVSRIRSSIADGEESRRGVFLLPGQEVFVVSALCCCSAWITTRRMSDSGA